DLPARADPPRKPSVRWQRAQRYQEEAPESLLIKVLSVQTSKEETPKKTLVHVVVRAKVDTVQRSASGLKKGSRIHITYATAQYKKGGPGPGLGSGPALMNKDAFYQVYLRKGKDGGYRPSAGSSSVD